MTTYIGTWCADDHGEGEHFQYRVTYTHAVRQAFSGLTFDKIEEAPLASNSWKDAREEIKNFVHTRASYERLKAWALEHP